MKDTTVLIDWLIIILQYNINKDNRGEEGGGTAGIIESKRFMGNNFQPCVMTFYTYDLKIEMMVVGQENR